MNKFLPLLIVSIFFICISATEDKWSQEIGKQAINSFLKNCNPTNSKQKYLYCECVLNEIKKNYNDPLDALKLTDKDLEQFIIKCLLKTKKNDNKDKWNSDIGRNFINSFLKNCKSNKNLADFCDCALKKIKLKYPDPKNVNKIKELELQNIYNECKKYIKN